MRADASTRNQQARALTIIELCLSDGRGGLEHYAAGLVPALRQRGHRLLVASQAGSEFEKRTGQPSALTLRHHRYLRWIGVRELGRLARDADVIHIHRSQDLALAVLARRHAGNRPALVYTRHMLIRHDRHGSPAHRFMFRHVDRLLTITDQISRQAHDCLPIEPTRITALPLGVSPADMPDDCGDIRPPGTRFVVGCFSRIEPKKGQHELIEAIARLHRSGIAAGCVIAGPVMDVAYENALKRQVAEAGLDEHVHFLGTLPHAQPAMSCCDAVVMPSTGEALGLVLIEAMLMGVPVIGSASGGVLEFIADGKTGLTYPVGDVEALTQRLKRLAEDRDFAKSLGEAGQRSAGEKFNRELHLDVLEQVFREAAAGS